MSGNKLLEFITNVDPTIAATAISTVATVIIAGFTVSLFFLQRQQHRHDRLVSNANLQLALFERRIRVVDAVRSFLDEFLKAGRADVEKISDLDLEARYAKFLFPEHITNWINELRQMAIECNYHQDMWESLRATSYEEEKLDADTEAQKKKHFAAMREIKKRFVDQVNNDRLTAEFGPYVKLPNAM